MQNVGAGCLKSERYRSHTDTETIIHLYEEEGPRCVERLQGMFAIAIWDARRDELFLARDRYGIKPLYLAEVGPVLLFGSEAKVFGVTGQFELKPHRAWLHQYITIGHVDTGDETFFDGVRLFPKACYAVVRGRRLNFVPYWTFDPTRDHHAPQ